MNNTCVLVSRLPYFHEPQRGLGVITHSLPLRQWYEAVTQAIPNTFLVRKDNFHAWVCHKRDPLTLGYVGYYDYSGGTKFGVLARGIDNGRFAHGAEYRHLLASADMATALRNARKHLRVHTTAELARATVQTARASIVPVLQSHREKANKAARVFHSHDLRAELKSLLLSGHVFQNPDVQDQLTALFAAEASAMQAEQVERVMYCVHVAEDWRGQVLYLHRLDGTKGAGLYQLSPSGDLPTREVVVSEILPDSEEQVILGRVSVLSMVDDNTYIEGVGSRITGEVFYVEV